MCTRRMWGGVVGLLVTCAAASAQVDNAWTQFHQGNGFGGQAGAGPDLRTYSTPRFQVGSGLGAGFMGASASAPVVMNNRVFCYSSSGAVTAFSEVSGAQLWSSSVEGASFGSWSSPSAD